jgi:hypothetical protein
MVVAGGGGCDGGDDGTDNRDIPCASLLLSWGTRFGSQYDHVRRPVRHRNTIENGTFRNTHLSGDDLIVALVDRVDRLHAPHSEQHVNTNWPLLQWLSQKTDCVVGKSIG